MTSSGDGGEVDLLKSRLLLIQKEVDSYQKSASPSSGENGHRSDALDMNSWLSRRNQEYAEIRDVRGASVLLSRSILQFLVPEKGIKVEEGRELPSISTHSKCNKDIRIGVTASCKQYAMKITGRGSIAGCESSNLIDIPIICDVLQSVGVFEDATFPTPSEKGERKSKKNSSSTESKDGEHKESSNETNETKSNATSNMTGPPVIPTQAIRSSSPVLPISFDQSSNSSKKASTPSPTHSAPQSQSTSTTTSGDDSKDVYAKNLVDIEAILNRRWECLLKEYLSDMQKRKTPYHYHAADGISVDGVAMIASSPRPSTPSIRLTPKSTPKIPKISQKYKRSDSLNSIDKISGASSTGSCESGSKRSTSPVVVDYSKEIEETVDDPKRFTNELFIDLPTDTALEKAIKKRRRKAHILANAHAIKTYPNIVPPRRDLSMTRKNRAIKFTKEMLKTSMPFDWLLSPRVDSSVNNPHDSVGSDPMGSQSQENDCDEKSENGNNVSGVSDSAKVSSIGASNESHSSDSQCKTSNASGSQLKTANASDSQLKTVNPPDSQHKTVHGVASTEVISVDRKNTSGHSAPAKTPNGEVKKVYKKKDLMVVVGGQAGMPPVLPPRIGSGGVGGTTTGYSITPSLLKPVSLKGAKEGGDPNYTPAQKMLIDPSSALKAWSDACYSEGMALEEEERLLREIASLCELSMPKEPFRIGTKYLDPQYNYWNYKKQMESIAAVFHDGDKSKEDVELLEKDSDQDSITVVRGVTKRRKNHLVGGSSHANGTQKSKKDSSKSGVVFESSHMMMHSAVALESPEGNIFDQFEGEEFEKVTSSNVALTASMLWQRAKRNAVHKPSTTDVKRPKREKVDFFEDYLSDNGGYTISAMTSTTLASLGGITHFHQHDDEEIDDVVSNQLEKVKKGSKSKSSLQAASSLHPGAVEAVGVHGVASGSILPACPPGAIKRQRMSGTNLTAADIRSSYLADTIGGYPTKNTMPPMMLQPSFYKPISPSQIKPEEKGEEEEVASRDTSSDLIQVCPMTLRTSLPDLTVHSVRMPWKNLAKEFHLFDPTGIDPSTHPSQPRTPTSQPSSPRGNASSGFQPSKTEVENEKTSNLNGAIGVWVSSEGGSSSQSSGLRITAPHKLAAHSRRKKKRSLDGSGAEESDSPRSVHGEETSKGAMEFKRIAFADVLAPSFRLVESENRGEEGGSDEEEEDISDEAMLRRHEATLSQLRDRWKAIQDLKSSLRKPSEGGSGQAAAPCGGPSSQSGHVSSQHKRRKPPPPSPRPKKTATFHLPAPSVSPKASKPLSSLPAKVPKQSEVSRMVTRHSKSPRSPGKTSGKGAPQPEKRKRGRPAKVKAA